SRSSPRTWACRRPDGRRPPPRRGGGLRSSRPGEGLLSVLLRAPVVLEDERAPGEDHRERSADDDPPVPERDPVPDDHDGQCHEDRPVAARAEEPELTGTVRDLGLLVVLRQRADAP